MKKIIRKNKKILLAWVVLIIANAIIINLLITKINTLRSNPKCVEELKRREGDKSKNFKFECLK